MTIHQLIVGFLAAHSTITLAGVTWLLLGALCFLLTAAFAPKTQAEMQLLSLSEPRAYGALLILGVLLANAQQLKRGLYCLFTGDPPPPPEDVSTPKAPAAGRAA